MKKASGKRRSRRTNAFDELQDGFLKGFISTGLLATLRGGGDRRQIMQAALQGGAALATASFAAGAIKRRSPTGALSAVAAGVAGLYLIDQFTNAAADESYGD